MPTQSGKSGASHVYSQHDSGEVVLCGAAGDYPVVNGGGANKANRPIAPASCGDDDGGMWEIFVSNAGMTHYCRRIVSTTHISFTTSDLIFFRRSLFRLRGVRIVALQGQSRFQIRSATMAAVQATQAALDSANTKTTTLKIENVSSTYA